MPEASGAGRGWVGGWVGGGQVKRVGRSVFFALVYNYSREDLAVNVTADGSVVAATVRWGDHVAGGLFGGAPAAIAAYSAAYFRAFNRLADAGHFVGKDQNVINTACVENPGLCLAVPPRGRSDPWHVMVPFLLGDYPEAAPFPIQAQVEAR